MTDDVALLLRRATFGPTAPDLAAARAAGYQATLASLLAPTGPDIGATSAPVPDLGPDPYVKKPTAAQQPAADAVRREQTELISRWWLDRMTVADHQAAERLVFFWHGHWATSVTKVKSPQLMLRQNRTMRDADGFADLAHRMVLDPALVYWLDGHLNTRAAPNENLARELFELFMVGIGHYGEGDVKEAGRALTGWRLDLGAEATVFDARSHDPGNKTILGTTAPFDARSLVDRLLAHPACPRFLAARLWFRYASAGPVPEPAREAMAGAFPAPTAMLRVLFEQDVFRATAGTTVKQPVEWLVGAMRQLGVRPAQIPGEAFGQILNGVAGMGQRPFAPPSVGGWPAGGTWLTSAAAHVRLSIAGKLASMAVDRKLTPDEVQHMLCVDRWTDRTWNVLRGVRNSRLLLTLGLVSPEYLVT